MIDISQLLNYINAQLNANAPANTVFEIYADGGDYKPPKRQYNTLTTYIQGVGYIADSSILPVNGLSIATQTLSVSIAVPIDPNAPTEQSLDPIRNALSAFISTPKATALDDEDGRTYSVSVYGSSPTAGEIAQRSNLGLLITYGINIYFSFIQNGINSLDCVLTFEGEQVPFTEMTVAVSPVLDGGAVSSSNGGAGNYATVFALEIQLSVPALTDSVLTTDFARFLLFKQYAVYDVSLTYNGITSNYSMIFATSNITARGVENIGQSITLVEAIDFETGAQNNG